MGYEIKLTVLFDNSFWVGLFESIENGIYKVCKVTFGPEPRDDEVYNFILRNYYSLRFSNTMNFDDKQIVKKKNPKRIQREVQKATMDRGISTKAQIAMSKQHEELKLEKKKRRKQRNEEESERKFLLKQKKRLKKHKGH